MSFAQRLQQSRQRAVGQEVFEPQKSVVFNVSLPVSYVALVHFDFHIWMKLDLAESIEKRAGTASIAIGHLCYTLDIRTEHGVIFLLIIAGSILASRASCGNEFLNPDPEERS